MNTKPTGWVAFVTLVLTTIWLVLLVIDMVRTGSLDTYEQTLAHVSRLDALYYTIYIASGLLTATTAMFMAGLYGLFRQTAPPAALFAFVFVPVYAVLNLFVYLSQVTVVPALIAQQLVAPSPAVDALLRQMIHQSPGSLFGFANALAYAVLGIPSAIFGVLLLRDGAARREFWPRAAGLLLAASGALSLAGFVALFGDYAVLEMGLVAGGAVFWLALFPLSYTLLRGDVGPAG